MTVRRPGRTSPVRLACVAALALALAGCGGVDPAARAADALKAGMAAQIAQDFDTAARDYREVLHAQPGNVYAYYNLALVYEEQGDPTRAEYYYRIALGHDPAFVSAMGNLGRLLGELGRVDEAILLTLRVSEIYPDYAVPYIRLAVLYDAAGRTEEAEQVREKARTLDPSITDETAQLTYGPADTGSVVMQLAATTAP